MEHQVTLYFYTETHSRQLNMEVLRRVDPGCEIAFNLEQATHVVTKITYGGEMFLTFEMEGQKNAEQAAKAIRTYVGGVLLSS